MSKQTYQVRESSEDGKQNEEEAEDEEKKKKKKKKTKKVSEEEKKLPFFKRQAKRVRKSAELWAVKWVTRQIAEVLGQEYVLMTTLKETVYFAIFAIFATIICLGTINDSSFHMFKVLEEQLLSQNSFMEITSASDTWLFLVNLFDRSFYWDYWYYPAHPIANTNKNDRNLFYENKLLGVPRVRQVKVRNDSCIVHRYFRRIFLSCYNRFSLTNEDTKPFGPGKGTAWTHHTQSSLSTTGYWGKIDSYHGGGYFQDLSLYRNETVKIIADLKKNLWITRGTRAIFVDFTVYNGNINLFAFIRAALEFPPTGGVIPSYRVYTAKLIRYYYPYDFFIMGCEMVVVVFLIYYFLEELREIMYFKWKYFKLFWSYIDTGLYLLGFSSLCLNLYRYFFIFKKLQQIIDNPNKYANLESFALIQVYHDNILAIMIFFIYLKIFKYLNFNKSMAQLNNTLAKCRKDMMGFAIMFFVIFVAFAVLGYLLFGMEVEDFSSFYLAMFTLLRTILGDFDYKPIENANRVLAPIFFLCFIFLVFFVLLNMFLAIINDTYTDVKTEIAIAPDELRMSGFIKRGYYNTLIKLGCGKRVRRISLQKNEYQMTYNEIKAALKKIGFSDLEIEMFYARYNIDENAEVANYDVQKLLDALEGKTEAAPPTLDTKSKIDDTGKQLVSIDDFVKQQEKLDDIEAAILKATKMMNNLLSKLDSLDNVSKKKRGQT